MRRRRGLHGPYSEQDGRRRQARNSGPQARLSAAKSSRRRPARSRTALVLGGGGFTGEVYEIGALRALDLLAVNRTVNQFDVYVGTSAGLVRGGPGGQQRDPRGDDAGGQSAGPHPVRTWIRGTLMRPNALEFAQSAARMPLRLLGVGPLDGGPAAQRLDRPGRRLRRGTPFRALRRSRHPAVPRGRAQRPGSGERLPPARERAVSHRHRPRYLRAHRARGSGLGGDVPIARAVATPPPFRWSTSRWRSRAATWWTGACVPPPTSAWRSRRGPSS